jgi:hypothetical protein
MWSAPAAAGHPPFRRPAFKHGIAALPDGHPSQSDGKLADCGYSASVIKITVQLATDGRGLLRSLAVRQLRR